MRRRMVSSPPDLYPLDAGNISHSQQPKMPPEWGTKLPLARNHSIEESFSQTDLDSSCISYKPMTLKNNLFI